MLPEEHREMASVIGVQVFLQLCHHYGGSNLYIPKLDRVTRQIRNLEIRHEFNDSNYKEISRKYNLSESHVRKIIGNSSSYEQTSIFEFLK